MLRETAATFLLMALVSTFHARADDASMAKTSIVGPPLEADSARLCGAATRNANEAAERQQRAERDYRSATMRTAGSERAVKDRQADLDRARRNPKKWDVDSVASDHQDAVNALRSAQAVEQSIKAGLDRLRATAAPLVRRQQDCVAEAGRRRSERLAIVDSRPIEEIRAIPSEYQLPEERDRIAKLAAADAQARRERIDRKLKDPKIMRVVFSAALCNHQAERKAATNEIASEKKYAREGGGVVDNRKLYTLQQKQRTVDEDMAKNRSDLRALGVSPLGCRDRLVSKLAACIATYSPTTVSPQVADRTAVAVDDRDVNQPCPAGYGCTTPRSRPRGEACDDATISEHFEVIE